MVWTLFPGSQVVFQEGGIHKVPLTTIKIKGKFSWMLLVAEVFNVAVNDFGVRRFCLVTRSPLTATTQVQVWAVATPCYTSMPHVGGISPFTFKALWFPLGSLPPLEGLRIVSDFNCDCLVWPRLAWSDIALGA